MVDIGIGRLKGLEPPNIHRGGADPSNIYTYYMTLYSAQWELRCTFISVVKMVPGGGAQTPLH